MISTAINWPIFATSIFLQPLKYDVFDFLQVSAHGNLGGCGVASLHSGKNSTVTSKGLFLPSFSLQRVFPGITQQIHQYVYYLQNRAVVGGQSDAVVKLRVLLDGEF